MLQKIEKADQVHSELGNKHELSSITKITIVTLQKLHY